MNLAQGLKSAAINFLASEGTQANASAFAAMSRQRMANLDDNFGQPTGMYSGDEHLPPVPDRNPGRGIELCGVVESMFSYETMFQVHGDTRFADRAEVKWRCFLDLSCFISLTLTSITIAARGV